MIQNKIKPTITIVKKNGICHIADHQGRIKKYKPWLGDLLSFLYDGMMEKSVFPKKFSASIARHYEIMNREFKDINHKSIVELACGSGSAVHFLNRDNDYTGVDISQGLLRIANRKFARSGFVNPEFYVTDACDLPFQDHYFDIGICNLSLNFFPDTERFVSELQRVLKPNAVFYGCIPIPERKKTEVTIRGILHTAEELKTIFQSHRFFFESLPHENGGLFYFKTVLKRG